MGMFSLIFRGRLIETWAEHSSKRFLSDHVSFEMNTYYKYPARKGIQK